MSNPSVLSFALALAIAAVAVVTFRQRGPFAWLLRCLGSEALPYSVDVARTLLLVALTLVVFGVVLALYPQRIAELSRWIPIWFIVIPLLLSNIWTALCGRYR